MIAWRTHQRLEQGAGATLTLRGFVALRAQQRVLRVLGDYPLDGCWGYDLARLARVSLGRMYPILARLEGSGVVESWWVNADPRRRRRYRLVNYANGVPK